MTTEIPQTGLSLRTLITASGELQLSLVDQPVTPPGPDEVLVRIEAAPINPSDLGLLFGPADLSGASLGGSAERPVLTARVPERFLPAVRGRLDQSLAAGNEGAGVVIAAGENARHLIGRTVAVFGRAMYAQYITAPAAEVLLLPEGATAAEGASCFVNPLTALAMVETMRNEGHTALVHTAAASNLGQMLNRICLKDGVELVNIVRKPQQAELLRGLGAKHVVDSSAEGFLADLTAALEATGATIAFDAIGGGRLAGQILSCMEAAAVRKMPVYSRYGSDTFKQVYIYGGLDTGPTEFNRNFGFSWSLSGFLLTPFLVKAGPARAQALRERVAAELKTTFASHYTGELSLAEALQPANVAAYAAKHTGEKYLVAPNKGL
ncbi:zinc-binding dehydrogenase [Phenylobacterium sp.]|uniref:zinc-binding dehydrogenase n=1 Tax=Phenylobacterium sp. TaxID=1871053 RepID=UPI002B9BD7C4|nr:zinc-binding dehydrogenase [Phenylobacterium sp.]HVI34401.1 zinc-binding dehydrogenase [Phenylobacterium sp.]